MCICISNRHTHKNTRSHKGESISNNFSLSVASYMAIAVVHTYLISNHSVLPLPSKSTCLSLVLYLVTSPSFLEDLVSEVYSLLILQYGIVNPMFKIRECEAHS